MRTSKILASVTLVWAAGLTAALAHGGGSFDSLSDTDRQVFQERFTKEIWPAVERGGKKSCLGCHGPGGKGGGTLKMKGDPAKDFRMLLKEGFLLPDDSGSMLTRITTTDKKQMMPPPGKGAEQWTKDEIDLLKKFVADLDKKQKKR